MAISPVGFNGAHFAHAPVGEKAPDASRNVLEFPFVGSGVHDGGTSDGAGDAAGEFVAGETCFEGGVRHGLVGGSRLGRQEIAVEGDLGHVLADLDDEAAKPCVGDEQIAPAADDAPGYVMFVRRRYGQRDVLGAFGPQIQIGWSSDAEGGVLAHGLIAQKVARGEGLGKRGFERR